MLAGRQAGRGLSLIPSYYLFASYHPESEVLSFPFLYPIDSIDGPNVTFRLSYVEIMLNYST